MDSWDELHTAIAKGWPNYRHIAQPLLKQPHEVANKAEKQCSQRARISARLLRLCIIYAMLSRI